jgi:sensor histidine kinase regulating citrate/malate metabolism
VILAFGVLLLIFANQLIGRALRDQIDQRTLAITNNLSHAAAGPVIGNNILELYASLTKYTQSQGVAYAFIEDGNGKIIANSIRPFPTELVGTSTPDERKQVDTRTVTLQGKTVYETRVPILEGQLGAAHLGIWAEDVKEEINTIRLTFAAVIVVLLLVAVALAVFLVRAIIATIGAETDLPSEITHRSELKPAVENRIGR